LPQVNLFFAIKGFTLTSNGNERIANRYILLRQLGMGAMGAVYRATDRLTGETIALKRVLLSADNNPNVRLALTREFQLLASLRHPHIISVQDYGFDADQRPFVTMALLENAQELQDAAEPLDDLARLQLLLQFLQALAYLHRRGIVHRDLKPANVLVTADGLKVLDFGLATEADKVKDIAGTLMYMAPETLRQEGTSAASDLFAVGVMMYEMFTGEYPFDGDTPNALVMQLLQEEPDWTRIPDFDVSAQSTAPALRSIIHKLMRKDPKQRYQDATQVIRELCAAAEQPVPLESLAIRDSFLQAARFVGRDDDLATLMEALDQTLRGNGSQWLVGGESGVGKTRLLDELRTYALVHGALVLRGQEVAESSITYQLWREPIKRMALFDEMSDIQAGILKDIVPQIADILNRYIPSITRIDSKDERRRLAVTIADLFRRTQRPILLILEDLHWSNESLDPLELLAQVENTVPLMVVASYRSDETPDLPQRLRHMTPLKLERLKDSAVKELVASMLGKQNATPEVVGLLTRETEGNAYFLVETVRSLADESGSLNNIGANPLPAHVFAGGVQQVVTRRLAKLPKEAWTLLAIATIAGRQIDLRLLHDLAANSRISVEEWLTTCANLGIIEKWDERWRFSHDKLREAARAELTPDDRKATHGAVAVSIETLYPNDDSQAHALADHWRDAGAPAKEAHYAAIAGRRALQVGTFQEAKSLLQRALAQTHTTERIALLKWLGDAEEGLARYDDAIQHYNESKSLAEKHDDKRGIAAALDGIARVEDRRGDLKDAEDHFLQALVLARDTHDDQLIADTLNGLGTISAKRGQFEDARTLYGESLEIRRRIHDKRGIAASLNNLGIVYNYQGQYTQAKPFYEEALALRREIGDLRGIAGSLNNLAMVTRNLKSPKEAKAYYLDAVHMTRNNGDLSNTAIILNNLGLILVEDAEYRDARRIYEEVVKIGRSIGDDVVLGTALQSQARIARLEEELTEAEPLLLESLRILREAANQRPLGETLTELGMLYIAQGRMTEARTVLNEALTLQQTGDNAGLGGTELALGLLAVNEGKWQDAHSHLLKALRVFARSRAVTQTQATLRAFAQLANEQGDYPRAAMFIGTLHAHEIPSVRLREEVMQVESFARANLTMNEYRTAHESGEGLSVEEWIERLG
jgi:predicted ATPase/tRNA A-37 threonylcarbamoyl transferase component Bud32